MKIVWYRQLITINPTRVTRQSATAIDYILSNCLVNFDFKTTIFKSDISGHFKISFFLPMTNGFFKPETIYIHKLMINNNAIEMFCQKLHKTEWAEIGTSRNPNVCYKIFLKKFMSLYDDCFQIKIIKLKTKDIKCFWITIWIKKSSKLQQCLYEEYLKIWCKKAENAYKNYKDIFELHFSN